MGDFRNHNSIKNF